MRPTAFIRPTNLFRSILCVTLLAGSATCRAGHQPVPPTPPGAVPVAPAQNPQDTQDKRSAKQKVLASDVDQLVAMATQLKAEVDKTNKNILSVKVVREAEQIELLAHRMKEREKK
jgi:hypothetical protein